ncbi:hypothetical protein WOLCODRAFT_161833 [Wolfiporia cocos MD-104 SS10]|uniref:Mitochondrial K+-H+ exchange-related-domain-containing protein n=1 Tax=Wolfiporia cocos (strain MD-104) TaxID=742152 RepID=A0A2H3JC07_WOLCO|nr:hypothetical protein WOLCODRAFT_161833 [Wolfiporia cocos MD-104 SS10]
MSLAAGAKRSVRIIALPLATPAPGAAHTSSEHLTYYHFVTPPPPANRANSLTNRITTKAAELWAGFGNAPEGHWKRRTFLYGERLIDRALDFEELALKSFDTSLGPKLLPLNRTEKIKPAQRTLIPLVYPPSACASPLPHLRALLAKRTPRHRKGALVWAAVAPLTTPIMLIPLVPNFPFFFCAWRAWSHYQAFKASQYLERFLAQGDIRPEESAALDAVYAAHAPAPPDPEAPATPHTGSPEARDEKVSAEASETPLPPGAGACETGAARPHLLLTRAAVPALERALEIPPGSSFAADVYRALEQARLRLDAKGR